MSYGYVHQGPSFGARLLWTCELLMDVPALQGSQKALIPYSPWSNAFPWEFPNAFDSYANALGGTAGPRALLDHPMGAGFKEILVTRPTVSLRVVDVIELPAEKADGEALAMGLFGC